MAIKTTRWSPDTCKCIIDFSWDDSQAQEQREHTFANTVVACKFHEKHGGKDVHFDTVIDENRTKNIVLEEIRKSIPNLTKEAIDSKGEKQDVIDESKVEWSFDEDRKLNILLRESTSIEKTDAQQILSSKIGIDKVIVK